MLRLNQKIEDFQKHSFDLSIQNDKDGDIILEASYKSDEVFHLYLTSKEAKHLLIFCWHMRKV